MITQRIRRTVTATQNKRAQLSCTAQGIPKPTITWKRKQSRQIVRTGITNSNTGNRVTSSVTISRVQAWQAGVYICTATNTVTRNPIEVEIRLVVQGTFVK